MVQERLHALLKELELSQRQFAKRLRIDPAYVSRILSGKAKATERLLWMIEKEFSVNPVWLREGKGKIFTQKHLSSEQERIYLWVSNLSSEELQIVQKMQRLAEEISGLQM